MVEEAMAQTLELAKTYIKLDDSVAAEKLASLSLDDIRDTDVLGGCCCLKTANSMLKNLQSVFSLSGCLRLSSWVTMLLLIKVTTTRLDLM